MPDLTPAQVLDLPLPPDDSGADTIRGYLLALLAAIWMSMIISHRSTAMRSARATT